MRIGVHGWIRRARTGTLSEFGVEGQPYWEDNETVSDRVPLGVLTVGRAPIWVMEDHAGETGSFSLLEIGRSEVRFIVGADAGGC